MKIKRIIQALALRIFTTIQFYLIDFESKTVVWLMKLLNSNKLVVFIGFLVSLHMLMKIIVDVFMSIAG